MVVATALADEILQLKAERRAVILAHHYQEPEIQEIADSIGDSLELARIAQKFEGDVIAFCGVRFMAETAKVLNPNRIVILPDLNAGCSLVDSCPAEAIRIFHGGCYSLAMREYFCSAVRCWRWARSSLHSRKINSSQVS